MNLVDFLSEIEVDEYALRDVLSDLSRCILISELKSFRECRINDYLCVKDGVSRSIYVHGDLEQDAFEISRRIEAIDIILEEYTLGHERFDFESVEWWDDKEEGMNMPTEIVMDRKLFDLSELELEKFKDIVRITSYIVKDTGLEMTGVRFDGGVIGFGRGGYEEPFVSYNIDNDWLFVNDEVLTESQVNALKEIADIFDLTIKEYDNGSS